MMNNFSKSNQEKACLKELWPFYLAFFTSTDTILFGTNENVLFNYVPRIIGVLIIFVLIFRKQGKIIFNIKCAIITSVMIAILCGTCFANGSDVMTIVSRAISILTAFAIVSYYSSTLFAIAFDQVMSVVAIVAIVIEAIAYLTPQIFLFLPTVINTSGNTFVTFFLGGVQISSLNSLFVRSSGIFWEPGAFAIYLIIALVFQMFVIQTEARKILLYSICLLMTFSTTGYIAYCALLLVYIATSDNSKITNRIKGISLISLTVIIALIIFGENTSLYNIFFGKIVNRESTSITRYASIVNGLEIGVDYPLFGIGPNKMQEYMAMYAMKSVFDFGANPWNTNTTTYQFAAYGLLFGLLFVIGTYKFFSGIVSKRSCGVGIFLVILLAFCGEVFFSFLPYVFVLYGYQKKQKRGNYESLSN